jgi:hypothetical protein
MGGDGFHHLPLWAGVVLVDVRVGVVVSLDAGAGTEGAGKHQEREWMQMGFHELTNTD